MCWHCKEYKVTDSQPLTRKRSGTPHVDFVTPTSCAVDTWYQLIYSLIDNGSTDLCWFVVFPSSMLLHRRHSLHLRDVLRDWWTFFLNLKSLFWGEGLGSVCDVTKVSIHIVFSVLVYFVYMEGEDFSFFSRSFELALIFINTKSQQSCQYSPALCTSIIKQKSLLNAIPRLNQFYRNI